ncbi:MAG TPA: TlpA family protein disulfide reductase, partial [Pseudonocardiaceae bacterium]|nr:TlpA family protein disulfide reductase [Pseudonocardiaceae bacterium]
MSRALRWVLVTVVLVFALAVALWPVTHRSGAPGAAPAASAPESIAVLRSRAALGPCPAPSP